MADTCILFKIQGALNPTGAQGVTGSDRMLLMLLRRFMDAGKSRRRFAMDFEKDTIAA
jgi:hypothetical protein